MLAWWGRRSAWRRFRRPMWTRRRRSTLAPAVSRRGRRPSSGPPSRRRRVDDWVPTYTLRDGAGASVGRGRLVECADLARPETFSGLDTVAVSSFEMGSALQSRHTVGVVAGGQQIYATDTSTYVSTTDWDPEGFGGQDDPAQVRHRRVGREQLPRIGRGPRNPAQLVRDVGVQGRPAGCEHRVGKPGLGQLTIGDRGCGHHAAGTGRRAAPAGPGRRARSGGQRVDHGGALHRGARVRGDVPADGSALRP